MLFYKILQEYFLNVIFLLSVLLVSFTSFNPVMEPLFKILENISYGLIASIIFYYINIIYASSKADARARDYLIKRYKELREIQMNIIYGILMVNNRASFNRDLLYNPVFFSNYFMEFRKSGYIWFDIIVNQMDDYSKDLFIDNMSTFKKNLLNHLPLLNLTNKAKLNLYYFIDQIEKIEKGNNETFYELILANCCGFSHETGNFYETDPQLFYLDEKNFTFKKWRYIKYYAISFYFIFWTLFAINTFT